MKPFVFFLLGMLFFNGVWGQGTRDTLGVALLIKDAKDLIGDDNKEALLKLDSAEKKILNTLGEASDLYGEILIWKGEASYFDKQPDKAFILYEKALKVKEKFWGIESNPVAKIYYTIGFRRLGEGNKKMGFEYLEIARLIWEKNLEFRGIGNCYYRMAVYCQFSELNYSDAVIFFQKSLEAKLKAYGPNSPNLASPYTGLADCYQGLGEIEKAIVNYQHGLKCIIEYSGIDEPSLIYIYYPLIDLYLRIGDRKKASEYQEKALSVYEILDKSTRGDLKSLETRIADIYAQQNKYDQAIQIYQNWIDDNLKVRPPDHMIFSRLFQKQAIFYFEKKDYKKAIDLLEKSIAINQDKRSLTFPEIITAYNILGDCYVKGNDYIRALLSYESALQVNGYNAGKFDEVISINNCSYSFTKKGEIYLLQYGKFKTQETLLSAKANFQSAMDAIHYQRSNVSIGKESIAANALPTLQSNILVNKLLFEETGNSEYFYHAFNTTEASRSLTLFESMRQTEALSFAGIPPDLLKTETDLRLQITNFEKRRFHLEVEENKPLNDSTLIFINTQLLELKNEYRALQSKFELEFPDYYRLKYDLETASLSEVQSHLQPNQTLLEYFTGDSAVYIFVVRRDHYQVVEVQKDFPLDSLVADFRKGIENEPENLSDQALDQYIQSAQALYRKLLAPVEDQITGSLLIVPDGVLGYLPFEALLSGRPGDVYNVSTYPVALKKYAISYCYSATLWQEMARKQHLQPARKAVLALAPFYKGTNTDLTGKLPQELEKLRQGSVSGATKIALRSVIRDLPESGMESYFVQHNWGGQCLIGSEATRAAFIAEAGNYRILHLATHGIAKKEVGSGEFSYLAFAPVSDTADYDPLYVRDLYNLRLNADLVTLSACETGIGELQRGEGVLSLARAFAYAGAKSIITTLWAADDASSKDLIEYFYLELKKGLPKDEALRNAKLWYLENGSKQKQDPFFWAGFIAIGDMSPLK